MRRPLLFVLLVTAPVVLAQRASGPSASDLYHSAAQAYIDGQTEPAIRDAERSLALDPGNEKTQRLLDLLRQDRPPQDGDDGQQDDSSQSDEEDQSEQQDQGGQGEPEQDEAERDETRQNRPQDGREDEADSGREDDRQRDAQPTPQDGGQPRPAQMSAAQAQRLLDAVAADEELLVERMRRPSRMRRSERDW